MSVSGFYFILCAILATGHWMMSASRGVLPCVLQEETVALRREGNGVLLECRLPHLIGTDLLGARIVLYYLKVNCKWHWAEWVFFCFCCCFKITSKQRSVPFFLHCDLWTFSTGRSNPDRKWRRLVQPRYRWVQCRHCSLLCSRAMCQTANKHVLLRFSL